MHIRRECPRKLRGFCLVVAMSIAAAAGAHEPAFSVLHTFDVADAVSGASATGSQPDTRPALGLFGDIFGMAYTGGVNGTGVVYRYDPYARHYTVLHTFGALDTSTNPNGTNADGAYPGVALTRGWGEVFYGMTSFGGQHGNGTIFSIEANGAFKVLHTFSDTDANGDNDDGANPLRTLVVGQDGNLYGTTRLGGHANLGVAFVIDRKGAFKVIHQYDATEGHAASLTQAYDGYLYGCAVYPRAALGSGILYRMLPTGHAFEILHQFAPVDAAGTNVDGANCYEPLVEARSGEFYGTTPFGGKGADGVVFRYTARDGIQVIHDFSGTDANGANSDGANPFARLTIGGDGWMYSTASYGGANGNGVVYKISSQGRLEVLHDFSVVDATTGANHDGATPDYGVIWDYRGQLIGITDAGGKGSAAVGYGNGTLYSVSPAH